MAAKENTSIRARIDRMRTLSAEDQGSTQYFEAASLAQSGSLAFETTKNDS